MPLQLSGVRWARFNVACRGHFVSNFEDLGGLFTWNEAQTACPPGWRLPTEEESDRLSNAHSVWTTRNGVNGRLFGTAPHQVFLPAAGGHFTGARFDAGTGGHYWVCTPDATHGALRFSFGSSGTGIGGGSTYTNAFSVRCVRK